MTWIIIIAIIVGYIFWKFKSDTQEVERRNISYGGMKKLFPEFVEFYEADGYELVEDTGTRLTYKKALTDNPPFDKYLFLGIESKFTNIAYGYIITGDGKKINGLNVEFRKNFRPEEVEMIIRKITGDLKLNGYLNDSSTNNKTSAMDNLNEAMKLNGLQDLFSVLQDLNKDGTENDVMPEGIGAFGLENTNPIPVNTVFGSKSYLDRLRTLDGKKVVYKRTGSTSAENISSMIDCYEISVNGQEITTLFICPYNKKNSNRAPMGFSLAVLPMS